MPDGPRYDHDHPDDLFLGHQGDYDVYFRWESGAAPQTVIRWGDTSDDFKAAQELFDQLSDPLKDATRKAFVNKDEGVRRMLGILDRDGPLHYEQLEHRWEQETP